MLTIWAIGVTLEEQTEPNGTQTKKERTKMIMYVITRADGEVIYMPLANDMDIELNMLSLEFEKYDQCDMPFEAFPKDVRKCVLGRLKAYDECFVTFENGEFRVSTGCALRRVYANDFYVAGSYKASELYTPDERRANFEEVFGYKPVW